MLWELIKHKLAKIGCFVFIVIIAIFVGLLTTWALSWLGDTAAETKGKQAAESAAEVLLVVTIVVGPLWLCSRATDQVAGTAASPAAPTAANTGSDDGREQAAATAANHGCETRSLPTAALRKQL